jgi:hypothetical protein
MITFLKAEEQHQHSNQKPRMPMKTQEQPQSFVDGNKYFLRVQILVSLGEPDVAVEHFLELIGTQECVGERKVQVDWIPKGLSPMGTLDWLKARTGAVEVSNKKEGGQL